ncbi:Signal transduction histidine kinase [Streptococcus suis]|uniref:Sigma-70 family RNA polymerase sigma factor n=1 Tax=Streptococcus suis TaxID=1307 RepID=A0AB37G364_STRSU|nr:hypothetical protein [Streptococcus suis]MCQ8269917.1 hypothetical protein [Streptococcus suis]MDN2998230.1 hypothetical protein [Streptococcus suis]MDW8659926.1 hypothetical protein [Streptococcus suis]MDW8686317.1 hypothetical protein [Streptococcus suis]QOE27368.1 hypothetical protein SSU1300283_00016 [Streptococcus suis]
MEFEKVYASVKGIVNKARKEFYIKLWDRDDWEQEGMMTLFELLEAQPWLVDEQVQKSNQGSYPQTGKSKTQV